MTTPELGVFDAPLHHLQFDDIKLLGIDELTLLKVELIDSLTRIEVVISKIKSDDGHWESHATVREHLKRVITTVNGVRSSKVRAENSFLAKQKEKLKCANIKVRNLEQEVVKLKRQIKTIEEVEK